MATLVIAGAGALGSLYGAILTEAGADVVLIARGAHAEAMRRRGLELRSPDDSVRRLQVRVAEEARADFVLLTAKVFDSAAVVGRIAGEPRLAVSFQNGPAKDDVLIDRFGRGRVTGGVTMAAAELVEPGVVMCSSLGVTYLAAAADGARNDAAAELAQLLEAAGLPARLTDEIESVEWSKLATVCGLMALQLISNRFVHETLRQQDAGFVMRAIATEVDAVARRRGIELRDWPGLLPARSLVDGSPADAAALLLTTANRLEGAGATAYRTSLLQDFAAGRQTELDLIHGAVIGIAAEEGVPTPALETAYRLCRLMGQRP